VESTAGVWLVRRGGATAVANGSVEAFGWLNGRLAVAVPGLDTAVVRLFARSGASRGSYHLNGIVVAVAPKLAVVQRAQKLLAGNTTLLIVPRHATVRDLAIG